MTCQPNHPAAAPKTASQAPAGSKLSRGTSIPAIATPITTCTMSAAGAVGRRPRRAASSLVTQYPAVTIMTAASR